MYYCDEVNTWEISMTFSPLKITNRFELHLTCPDSMNTGFMMVKLNSDNLIHNQ